MGGDLLTVWLSSQAQANVSSSRFKSAPAHCLKMLFGDYIHLLNERRGSIP